MMSCPPQLNADTDSPNRRDTICLRDNVGSGFDGMAPESMSGGSCTYMTHTGGGIAGIEMRSCTSLRKAKSKPKNGQSYAFQCYCISTKTALAAVLLRRLDDLPRTSLLFHSFLVTMRGDGVSTFQQVHLIITIHEVKLAVIAFHAGQDHLLDGVEVHLFHRLGPLFTLSLPFECVDSAVGGMIDRSMSGSEKFW